MSSTAHLGVLLTQIGTPDAPTPKALRRYLHAFLTDRRVVDRHPLLWRPILHGIILRRRPRRSALLYKRIWTEAGSPLLLHTAALATALGERLGPTYDVTFGMQVGSPSVASRLDEMLARGLREIIVLPLYPQQCSATTASAFDCVARWARGRRDLPTLHFVRGFADHPAYIEALRASVECAGVKPTAETPLIFSYHGIPQRYAADGDPYPADCTRTTRALVAALGLADDAWQQVYQSRFGREAWLMPYAEQAVKALPTKGISSLAVITPSFVADCLETIDEVGRELRASFIDSGGEHFTRIPCLNADPEAADALAQIIRGVTSA